MSLAEAARPPIELGVITSPRGRVFRRLLRRPVAVVAIFVIVVIYGAGLLAPLVAPYGYKETDFEQRFAGPSWDHPFGTDRLGRDLFSQAVYSARTTVVISVTAVASGSLILGVTLGLLAGYVRGAVDYVIMRLAEIFASVPTILLLLIITASLQDRVEGWAEDVSSFTGLDWIAESGTPSYFLVFGVLALFGWVGTARIVRSQVLALRESAYIIAARAAGASTTRILSRHLLPNVSNLLIVGLTASLGAVAAAEVGLTFIGVGIQDNPSFGIMISEAVGPSNFREHPQLLIVPGVFISLLVLSFNLLGDQLTDVLSPRRR